jgi:hypothetical protein
MQRVVFILAVGLLSLGMAISSQGAVSWSGNYTFSTANNNVPNANNGISFGAFTPTGVTADTWSSSTARYGASGWGTTFGNYVSFVLTPSPAISGYTLNSLSFTVAPITKMGTTGAGQWAIYSGTTLDASGTFNLPANGSTATISPTVSVNFNSSPLTIRFYGIAINNGADSDLAFDNVTVGGVSPVPEPVNVALGIFGGVFVLVIVGKSRPVRNRLHHWCVGVNQWLDAV